MPYVPNWQLASVWWEGADCQRAALEIEELCRQVIVDGFRCVFIRRIAVIVGVGRGRARHVHLRAAVEKLKLGELNAIRGCGSSHAGRSEPIKLVSHRRLGRTGWQAREDHSAIAELQRSSCINR